MRSTGLYPSTPWDRTWSYIHAHDPSAREEGGEDKTISLADREFHASPDYVKKAYILEICLTSFISLYILASVLV